MDKYKNKDGIELSYTQRNNTQTDLVKEVISESIKILGMCDKNCKISMGIAMSNTKKFLRTNFDIEVVSIIELCVLCNKDTPYDKDVDIDQRQHYVEGSGQMCEECWTKTYDINRPLQS